jgi:hypothetical protein
MCVVCDGLTREEALQGLHGTVQRYGWAIQYVEGEGPDIAWAYTIGLMARYGHPELALVGWDQRTTALALRDLVDRMARGERFVAGTTIALAPRVVAWVGKVHPNQMLGGVFDGWLEYYDYYPSPPGGWEALEIVLGVAGEPRRGHRLHRAEVAVGPGARRGSRNRSRQRPPSRHRPRSR